MDDPNKKIDEIAKVISSSLGINTSTCHNIIAIKRKGFESTLAYLNWFARKKGFKSFSKYQTFREFMREPNKYKSTHYETRQDKFEKSLVILPNEELDKAEHFPDRPNEEKSYEQTKYISRLLDFLPKKQQSVIKKYFYESKTLEEIGKEMNMTRQRAHQIKNEALKKLYIIFLSST